MSILKYFSKSLLYLTILSCTSSYAFNLEIKAMGSMFLSPANDKGQITLFDSTTGVNDSTKLSAESISFGAAFTIMEETMGLRSSYEILKLMSNKTGTFTNGADNWTFSSNYQSTAIGADIIWKFSQGRKFSYFLGAGVEKHYLKLNISYTTPSTLNMSGTSETFGGKAFFVFKYFPINEFAVSLETGYRYAEFKKIYAENDITYNSSNILKGERLVKFNGSSFGGSPYSLSLTGAYVQGGIIIRY